MLLKTLLFIASITVCLIYIILFLKLKKQFEKQIGKSNLKNFIKNLIENHGFVKILIHYLIFVVAIMFTTSFIKTFIVDPYISPGPNFSQKKIYYLILTPFLPIMFCFRKELEKSIHNFCVETIIKMFGNFKHVHIVAFFFEYLLAGLFLLFVVAFLKIFK